jgi:RecB family endonuclease NucS
MVLVIQEQNPEQFAKVEAGNFTQYSIWERAHIQEWIRQAPEVLGEDLLVVSMEFDRFKQSADRLDLLALDRKGNLVVVELKRDGLAGYADL